ncbi:hypothetical protein GCM10025762_39160 [Haloechinothrix salitolerans]
MLEQLSHPVVTELRRDGFAQCRGMEWVPITPARRESNGTFALDDIEVNNAVSVEDAQVGGLVMLIPELFEYGARAFPKDLDVLRLHSNEPETELEQPGVGMALDVPVILQRPQVPKRRRLRQSGRDGHRGQRNAAIQRRFLQQVQDRAHSLNRPYRIVPLFH